MSKKDEKQDITRIEDLSEFLHEIDDEEFPDPDEGNGDFSGDSTDPDIKVPGDLTQTDISEFGDFESSDSFDETSSFDTNDFNSDDSSFETDDNFDADDSSFGSDDDSFESDDNFGSDNNDFGSSDDTFDSEDSFGSDDNSFGADDDSFGSDDNNFGSNEDSFNDSENDLEYSNSNNSLDNEFAPESELNDQNTNESLDEFEDKTETPISANKSTGSKLADSPPDLPVSNTNAQRKEQSENLSITAPIISTGPKQYKNETIKKTENFEEISKFSSQVQIVDFAVEGNPPFSIIVKNIKYIEDIEGILSQLTEIGYIKDNKEQVEKSLKRGKLLISRISEFSAIYLCHKLREFSVDIEMGLSDEIHPPKENEKEQIVLTKRSAVQNLTSSGRIKDSIVNYKDVIISTTPALEGFQIDHYFGILGHSLVITINDNEDEEVNISILAKNPYYFEKLSDELKLKCVDKKANAIVGLNFQIIPLDSEKNSYELVGTGNAVWVSKI